MRTSVGFDGTGSTVVASPETTAAAVARGGGSVGTVPHSAWRSPVPYLFGGLAAMLGLIAFALLILACSYWKLSGFLEGGSDSAEDAPSKPEEPEEKPMPARYEERIVVIMAGEEKPRYLATPICSRASSFGDNSSNSSTTTTITGSSSSSSDVGSSGGDGEVEMNKVDAAEGLSSSHDENNQLNHEQNQEQ